MTTTENKKIIYESPDGGNTVYARQIGTTDRTVVRANKTLNGRVQHWREILTASETNETLAKLIRQVEVFYELAEK